MTSLTGSVARFPRQETTETRHSFFFTIHAFLILFEKILPAILEYTDSDSTLSGEAHHVEMPARAEEEWSDSDGEYDSSGGVETNVQLGIPDGPIKVDADLKDPRVSRIGGHPVGSVHSASYTIFCSLYTLRCCSGFPCIISPRCVRFTMQKLFGPYATRLPDLVPNRR